MIDYKRIPKIENHLHMEGAIPYETLWQLIQKYGGDKSVSNLEQLKERFKFRDFNHFIEMWIWKNGFIREYEDFTLIADAVFNDLARQNIKYAEIFISPSSYREILDIQKIVEAIYQSVQRTEIKINLIIDFVRNLGPEYELESLHQINEVKDMGIIGIGIGGSENGFPPELFTKMYDEARTMGFRTTAHAGEAAGPESIWNAIKSLKVERIGHGTRAIEDSELVDYIAQNKIPIELCPISNTRTKVIETIAQHPIKRFIDKGIPVSINTDDPKMFNNSLDEEYQAVQDTFGFSDDAMKQMIINSIDTTWLNNSEKSILKREFEDTF